MAQIRKFQPGGKTSNKIGVLTIDGKEYTGDGFIQHMRDYHKTLDDKVADQFGNIINALEAGENLQYDSDSDVLTGNVNWNVSKLQEKRLDKGTDRTKIGQVFGALNEGKEQRVRYAINALRGMEPYEDPNNKIVKEEHDPKVFDWSNSIELDYTVKDGKKHVTKMDNAHVIDRLNQLKAVLSDKWAEDDNFTGWNGYTRDHYRNAYLEHSDSLSKIIKRISEGAWTDDDLSILKDIGVVDKQKKDVIENPKKSIPSVVSTAQAVNTSQKNSSDQSSIVEDADNTKTSKDNNLSLVEVMLRNYENRRNVRKQIFQDTINGTSRKKFISPRHNNSKDNVTVIKYQTPLFYTRDASNIPYIKRDIIKGEGGLVTSIFSRLPWQVANPITTPKFNTTYTPPVGLHNAKALNFVNPFKNSSSIIPTVMTSSNAGSAPSDLKDKLKSFVSNAFNYENLNTLGQVVGSIATNHKVAKIKEDLIKNTPIARNVFQMTVPKYYENTRGFDERKRAILNTVLPITSDAALNAKMEMNLLSEANKVDREKYDYLSKNIGEYLNNINTISNKNRELRVAESNNFLERLGQRNAALAENEIGKITNDYQTGIQLAKKSLYDFRNDRAQFNALQAQQQFLTKANEYQDAAKKYVKAHPMSQDAINTYGSDYLSYYLANNETAKNNYAKDRLQMQFDQYNLGRSSIFSPRFKSGGKLSAKDHIKINKAKTQNQMLLNQHKEVMKAVQKLNDDVFKIFLKMIK